MKKDFTRDYATEAFRMYAAMNKPTYKEAVKMIYDKTLEECKFQNPESANIAAKSAVTKAMPTLLDIMAVEKTISILHSGNKSHIAKAVSDVYFTQPTLPLRRGDISARVRLFALLCPTDERTVYRWLKEARLLCAAVRGLRISDDDKKKYCNYL